MSFRLAPLYLALCLASPAFAEKADRDKPLQVEAQRASVDDVKKIQILEGDVVLIKGTLIVQAERVIISEDEYGFQKSVAFGGKKGLARFRQKREGKDEYVEGEGERIEYSGRTEIAEFFHRAWVSSGDDQIKGDYIWYDSINEKYSVTAGETARDSKAQPARVRAIIQPKNKGPAPEQSNRAPASLDLRGASVLERLPEH